MAGNLAQAAEEIDVVVVGGGNAGFCAAHASLEGGASTLVLEKGVKDESGGNSFHTAGAFRFTHGGIGDLEAILDEESRSKGQVTELAPYSAVDFSSDMRRLTEDRCDPAMTKQLVEDSASAVRWLAGKGLRWRLMYERQSYQSQGRFVFFGGLAVGSVDGGKGLIEMHTEALRRAGGHIRYGAEVTELLVESGRMAGVRYRDLAGDIHIVRSRSVVLASGGFESDPERRACHLGAGWEHAIVRGTPLNTGEVLDLALGIGAARHGDWSSCHSVAWDADAPPHGGDRRLTNQRTRQSYPIGIVVNRDGARFLDEGADFRNYTYAKYGAKILQQPDGIAFQLFDAKTRPMLRTEEYDSEPIASARADSLGELADRLGVDRSGLEQTVEEFNKSIVDVLFDPAVKDGRAARTAPPKSNWAVALDTPPYYGFAVRCGLTFTFGGLKVNGDAQVLGESGTPIGGLFAAGEIVGGLFSGNYPGGSGLTAGAVYGRLAGASASRDVLAE